MIDKDSLEKLRIVNNDTLQSAGDKLKRLAEILIDLILELDRKE